MFVAAKNEINQILQKYISWYIININMEDAEANDLTSLRVGNWKFLASSKPRQLS
jgi:hypothetical protein